MAVVDARIRIRHPCPYCDTSVQFPRSHFLLWCDNRRDLFLATSPAPSELRQVLAHLRRRFHARILLREGRNALVELPDFEWPEPPSVTRLARRAGVWALQPVVYSEGWETYRLVSPSKPRLNRLIQRLRRLGSVDLLSVATRPGLDRLRDLPTASVHFFEGLTDRQSRSLIAAYEGGLFDVPARGRWEDIARREGLSRSTFGEHLRKAELRLVANSYPTLKARERSPSTA